MRNPHHPHSGADAPHAGCGSTQLSHSGRAASEAMSIESAARFPADCGDGFTLRVEVRGLVHLVKPGRSTGGAAWLLLPRVKEAVPGLPPHRPRLTVAGQHQELDGLHVELQGGVGNLDLLQHDCGTHRSLQHLADLDQLLVAAGLAPSAAWAPLLSDGPPRRLASRLRLQHGTLFVSGASTVSFAPARQPGQGLVLSMAGTLYIDIPVCGSAELVLSRISDGESTRIPITGAEGDIVTIQVGNHPQISEHSRNHFLAHYALRDPSLDLDKVLVPAGQGMTSRISVPLTNGVQCSPAQSGGGG